MRLFMVLIFLSKLFLVSCTAADDECEFDPGECENYTEYEAYRDCVYRNIVKRARNCEDNTEKKRCSVCDCNFCKANSCPEICKQCCPDTGPCRNETCCVTNCRFSCKTEKCVHDCRNACSYQIKPESRNETYKEFEVGTESTSTISPELNRRNDTILQVDKNVSNGTNDKNATNYVRNDKRPEITDIDDCCYVIGPKKCMLHTIYPLMRCVHERKRHCGFLCKTTLFSQKNGETCHRTPEGFHCFQDIFFPYQTTPKFYMWPYHYYPQYRTPYTNYFQPFRTPGLCRPNFYNNNLYYRTNPYFAYKNAIFHPVTTKSIGESTKEEGKVVKPLIYHPFNWQYNIFNQRPQPSVPSLYNVPKDVNIEVSVSGPTKDEATITIVKEK